MSSERPAEDPTGWFERIYTAAEQGDAVVPWDRGGPSPVLVEWARRRAGGGRRALVVGAGLGHDAEYVAGLGFETVAFDISPTAVKLARRHFPGSRVLYRVADVLNPPEEWRAAFDLVVEHLTVQSLPNPLRREAITQIGRMVAPGGSLLVISGARDEAGPHPDGPPWPLTRAEVESFASGGIRPVRIELVDGARWRAEFHRP